MNNLISGYVNKLTIDNINNFALKNNIKLNEKEQKIFLDIVKNHYQEILNGTDEQIKEYLKENLTNENYEKTIKLYNEYKEKYQGYL